jgi:hypothetical protein
MHNAPGVLTERLCVTVQVKAWCYYESRLLGAHHGLISTYALETLVLYVFNKYHQTLDSPLSVSRRLPQHTAEPRRLSI